MCSSRGNSIVVYWLSIAIALMLGTNPVAMWDPVEGGDAAPAASYLYVFFAF